MNRRKKRSESSSAATILAEANRDAALARAPANPPRPNKRFLITTAALLAMWILFLLAMAFV